MKLSWILSVHMWCGKSIICPLEEVVSNLGKKKKRKEFDFCQSVLFSWYLIVFQGFPTMHMRPVEKLWLPLSQFSVITLPGNWGEIHGFPSSSDIPG